MLALFNGAAGNIIRHRIGIEERGLHAPLILLVLLAEQSNKVRIAAFIIFLIVVLDIPLEPEEAADPCEPLHELMPLGGAVRNEEELHSEALVVGGEPLGEQRLVDHLERVALLEVVLLVLDLLDVPVEDDLGVGLAFLVPQNAPVILQLLPEQQLRETALLNHLHRLLDPVNHHSGILGDMLEELRDDLLLLDEADTRKGFLGELDCLLEAVLTAVLDVDDAEDDGLESLVQVLGFGDEVLELSCSGHDDALDGGLVVFNEDTLGELADLLDIGRPLLEPCPGETHR